MVRLDSAADDATEKSRRSHQVARDLAVPALSGIAAFVIASGAEWAAIRLLRLGPLELDWLSDVILAIAFATAVLLRMRLKASRTEMSQLERAHLVLDTQLAVAADIQRRSLPSPPRPERGCSWAAQLEPAGEVGGDFYDFIPDDDGSLLAVVADISGKGIPAALLLSSTRTLIRVAARQSRDPAELLRRLSAEIYAQHEGSPYVTCIAVRLDADRRHLVYVNAGHPAGIVVGGSAVFLDVGGPPLGVFAKTSYASARLTLGPGDLGLFVTDGVTESLQASGSTLLDALNAVRSRLGQAAPLESVCQQLMRNTAVAAAAADEQDDRTIVMFTLEGSS